MKDVLGVPSSEAFVFLLLGALFVVEADEERYIFPPPTVLHIDIRDSPSARSGARRATVPSTSR